MPDESYFRNEFRDTRIENLIQAQLVRLEAIRPPKPMEAALPPRHWVDRRDVLDEITEQLTRPEPSTVVITAPTGSGKTALLSKIASELRSRYADGQLYIDLASERPVSALRSVLMRLGEPKEQLAETLGGLLSHYRSATNGKSLLVMVDGVGRSQEGLLFQPNSSRSGFLLVSNEWPDDPDVRVLRLGDLDTADAEQLLRNFCPWIDASTSAALISAHGGSPATIRRLAGLIRARHHQGIDVQGSNVEALAGYSNANLLDATYTALSSSAAWLYGLFSALPGEEFERSMLAVFGAPDNAENGVFEELINAQLVTETHPGRYRVEPALDQDAARRVGAKSLPIELLAAMRRTLLWYLRRSQIADEVIMGDRLRLGRVPDDIDCPGFSSAQEALAWFQNNHAALLNAISVAVFHGWRWEAWALAEAMWAFFTNMPYPAEAERCYRLAASAADSAPAEARILAFLGKVLTDSGRFDEADEALQQSFELATAEGHAALIGTATELRGRLLHKRGRPAESIAFYEAALENARLRGRARSEAWQLMFLGQAYRDLGEPTVARDHFNTSLEKFVEAGDGRTATLVRFESAVLDVLGGVPEAPAQAATAIEWMRRLGMATHEARALERLGNALGGDEGKRYLEDALQIYERFGDVEADRLRRQLL